MLIDKQILCCNSVGNPYYLYACAHACGRGTSCHGSAARIQTFTGPDAVSVTSVACRYLWRLHRTRQLPAVHHAPLPLSLTVLLFRKGNRAKQNSQTHHQSLTFSSTATFWTHVQLYVFSDVHGFGPSNFHTLNLRCSKCHVRRVLR